MSTQKKDQSASRQSNKTANNRKEKNVGGIGSNGFTACANNRISKSFDSDGNKVRCRACRCQIMKKMSNVRAHSTCASHVSALQKLTSSKINESEVKTSLLYKRKPEFVGTAGERKVACDLTIAKGVNVLLKLEYDGTNRLHVTLGIMRGCRLFDYAFVANTPTPTVLEEMHHQAAVGQRQLVIEKNRFLHQQL
jgi:hypothetical protein